MNKDDLDDTELGGDKSPIADSADPAFERLLSYLKESRAFDFTGYKRASLMRRVGHQMRQAGVDTFDDYLDYLQVHPDEFAGLFNTILINVTGFFRDAEAWDYLATSAIPALLADVGSAPLRLWSAGCASGQEAYSLAMVLAEHLGIEEFRSRVKVYATDVDEEALAVARQAIYAEKELAGLPDGYQEKYFEPNGARFVFHKDLRRCVIFGRNDLVQDAPISRIDLLACRNSLMYFNAETQSRIISRLGFALKPNGILFLGKAEMLVNHADIFEPIDLKGRFFRKSPSANHVDQVRPESPRIVGRRPARSDDLEHLRTEAFLTSPVAQIVVDREDSLALVNHRAASLLGLAERDIGRPFQDLEVSYRPAELRSHLAAVHQGHVPVWIRDLEWNRSSNERMFLDVQLVPLVDPSSRLLGVAVMFNDVTRYRQLHNELEAANRQLETAYEELQSTNEELETTNEELQSTVEELETTNEELQSTNEELETMNEELQSMNDELQATNEELRARTGEITSLNEFMESILGSLRAAVVVVNSDFIVQVWNRQAQDLWGLREDETVGEHLLSLDSGLPSERLKPMVREVVFDGSPGQDATVEAVNRRGRSVSLRISVTPLMSGDGNPPGALLVMESSEEDAADPEQPR